MTATNHRDSENPALTLKDFTTCGWKEILSRSDVVNKGYFPMRTAFLSAAKIADKEGRPAHGKALLLLSDACSMMLSPGEVNEPFAPLWKFPDRRLTSAVPDSFHEADIASFAQFVGAIDEPWLKARLADLVWLVKRPREVKFALAAIDSYRLILMNNKTCGNDPLNCWRRAISLAHMLKEGAGHRLAAMEASVIKALKLTTKDDDYLCLQLADLLEGFSLENRPVNITIAEKLKSMALEFGEEGDLHKERAYFQFSGNWFKKAGEVEQSTAMTAATAESWVKQATIHVSSDQPSHASAAICCEKAIQTYRAIPHSKRAEHQVNERINVLRAQLSEYGKKLLDEMVDIRVPFKDSSDIRKAVRHDMSKKDTMEALRTFVSLYSMNAKKLREDTIKSVKNHPLQALISRTYMGGDGRVVAQRPGIKLRADSSDDDNYEPVIFSQMIEAHTSHVNFIVHEVILPALEILTQEHRLREDDFINIAAQSPLVPEKRVLLFGKALFAGYRRDFITALHIITPQIENMVRFRLKRASIKTTTLASDGIENENGLSSLMRLPKSEKIFGENLSFEIKALFCNREGPNLRNEVAHGLPDDDACRSSYAMYAWWLGLKLVFNAFWDHRRRSGGQTGGGGKASAPRESR